MISLNFSFHCSNYCRLFWCFLFYIHQIIKLYTDCSFSNVLINYLIMYNSSTAINTVMGLMSHLNASDLKEILNDDCKFEQYANELKPVSSYFI